MTHSLTISGHHAGTVRGSLPGGFAVCVCGFHTGGSLGEAVAVSRLGEHCAKRNTA